MFTTSPIRLICLVLTLGAFATAAAAEDVHEVHVVHQETDFSAAEAQHMFRFEPNILVLEPGETVAFLNSLGSHTVMSQRGLWPEDVEQIHIRGQTRSEVAFDKPGLYGITCARHGRYGMSMLIAVGEEGIAQAAGIDVADIPATEMARDAYDELLEEVSGGS